MKSSFFAYSSLFAIILGSTTCLHLVAAQALTPVRIPNATDPATAEIMGIHLYMNSKEVLAILNAIPDVQPDDGRPCTVCLNIGERDNSYTQGQKHIGSLILINPKYQLTLYFQESYPFDPQHPEILTDISYAPHGLNTDQDSAAFLAQVLSKYGPPQETRGSHYRRWYALGIPVKNKAGQVIRYDMAPNEYPVMVLFGNGLEITDGFRIRDKEQALWEKTRTTALPSF